MKKHALAVSAFLTLSLISTAAIAQQKEVAAVDPVDAIKAQYYAKFPMLPPARKCVPEDAKGTWRESGVLESGQTLENDARKKLGDRHLMFGPYNTLAWQRSLVTMNNAMIAGALKNAKLQYIMTASGMLYIYQGGNVAMSLMCLVSTEANKQYPAGQLILALPIEKDKPLSITLYAPNGK